MSAATLSIPAVLSRVRAVATEVVAPNAARVDQEAAWPAEGMRALLAAGLGGLVVPTALGGQGHGLLALTQVCEILGAACASTSFCFGMHSVATAALAAKATPVQADRFLRPICAGEHVAALALSESGTGAHFYLPSTSLRWLDADRFVLEGTKCLVTNGGYADTYVVSTVAGGPDAPLGQFSCAVVPHDAPGLTWGAPWNGLGLRGSASRSAILRRVTLPRAYVLGAEGDEIWYVFSVVAPCFLLATAGTWLGIAQSALDATVQHVGRRVHAHNGSRLAEYAAVQHRVARMWAEVERCRRLVYWAAGEAEADTPAALAALCSAKADVAECAVHVVNEALTACGGVGYRDEAALGRKLRDARAAPVQSPTSDVLRSWAGRAILGLPILQGD